MSFVILNCMTQSGNTYKTLVNLENVETIYESTERGLTSITFHDMNSSISTKSSIDEIINSAFKLEVE